MLLLLFGPTIAATLVDETIQPITTIAAPFVDEAGKPVAAIAFALVAVDAQHVEFADQVSEDDCAVAGHGWCPTYVPALPSVALGWPRIGTEMARGAFVARRPVC